MSPISRFSFPWFLFGLSLLCVLAFSSPAKAADSLVVHEWGTFTALQNEKGEALPGINIDDERLPWFVHNLHPWVLDRARSYGAIQMKGAPERHPYVTLRLETPVLYFYPPKDAKLPLTLDVDVAFQGGWLTEFYPHADADAPGLKQNEFTFGRITADTDGKLAWHKVQVGTKAAGPETESNVWICPRKVNSVSVTVPKQTSKDEAEAESEKFLFYRGVGNRPVPLCVTHDEAKHEFSIAANCSDVFGCKTSGPVPNAWLVHIRSDRTVAYRALKPFTLSANDKSVLATTSSTFADDQYSAGHLQDARAEMHQALVREGLFADEATAMLDTWQRAYFNSPGLRLFFLVPQAWTDAVLPLKLSQEARITRVMMGRIELISPEQRSLLKKLAATEVSDPNWIYKILQGENAQKFYEGRSDFGDLGVKIPADYQTYMDLGRFRNALILAEQKARPAKQLSKFIAAYGLYPYQVDEGEAR